MARLGTLLGDERRSPRQLPRGRCRNLGFARVNIGHNQDVAWTHTVSTNTTVTFWLLVLAHEHPTEYIYKDKRVAMKTRTVTVQALEHGELVPRTGTLYYSHYGPVIWEGGQALAVDDANVNNLRGVNQWLAISKAENASQVIESERAIQGVPWVNTVGADAEGNAFYSEIVVASSLTKAFVDSSCNLDPGSDSGPFLGDGVCEMPESPGAIVPGILAGSDEPSLIRKDYVENSNNSFWLANANSPLTGFSPALGGEEENPGCALRPESTWSLSAWAPTTAASRPMGSRRRPGSQPKRCRTPGPSSARSRLNAPSRVCAKSARTR